MRQLTLILALLVATQPALVVMVGSTCGELSCVESPDREARCGGCPSTATAESCCCATAPEDEPTPAPVPVKGQNEALRSLHALATNVVVFVPAGPDDETAPGFASANLDTPLSELTHNERLALHCISRT